LSSIDPKVAATAAGWRDSFSTRDSSLDALVLTPFLHHLVTLRHQGSFNIAHVKDSAGQEFATRLGNVFAVGKDARPWVSLPRGKGIKLSVLEQREAREKRAANNN
jgi:hypothetical protein